MSGEDPQQIEARLEEKLQEPPCRTSNTEGPLKDTMYWIRSIVLEQSMKTPFSSLQMTIMKKRIRALRARDGKDGSDGGEIKQRTPVERSLEQIKDNLRVLINSETPPRVPDQETAFFLNLLAKTLDFLVNQLQHQGVRSVKLHLAHCLLEEHGTIGAFRDVAERLGRAYMGKAVEVEFQGQLFHVAEANKVFFEVE